MGIGQYLKDYLNYYNISQKDFADRLDITPEHFNLILNKDQDISNDIIVAISLITDIDINFIIKIESRKKFLKEINSKFKTQKEIKEYIKEFNINYLEKNNWKKFKDKHNDYEILLDLFSYLKVRNINALNNITDRYLFKKKNSSTIKLSLWIARCNELSNSQEINDYTNINLKDLLIELKEEQNKIIDIERITKLFNIYGIYFVVEEAMPGTKVRGCFTVRNESPCIYLTKLHKEKSSFYFALYHELGHLKSDYNKGKNKVLIDGDEILEQKADEFALNQMIPSNIWIEIITTKKYEEISKEYNIPMCFIVSRLAKEKIISYNSQLYNKYKEIV